jgi:hypothetical protein
MSWLRTFTGIFAVMLVCAAGCNSGSREGFGFQANANGGAGGGGAGGGGGSTPGSQVDLAVTTAFLVDVSASGGVAAAPPAVGEQIFGAGSLDYEVANQGTADSTADVFVTAHSRAGGTPSSSDPVFDRFTIAAGFVSLSTVSAATGNDGLGFRCITPATTAGTYSYLLAVDAAGSQPDSDVTNNNSTATASDTYSAVTGGPDLTPGGFIGFQGTGAAFSIDVGIQFQLTLDLLNVGDTAATAPSLALLVDSGGNQFILGTAGAGTPLATGQAATQTFSCVLAASGGTTPASGQATLAVLQDIDANTGAATLTNEVNIDNNLQLEFATVN